YGSKISITVDAGDITPPEAHAPPSVAARRQLARLRRFASAEGQGVMEAPGEDQRGDEREAPLDADHGGRGNAQAQALELVLGDPEQGDRSEAEGQRRFSSLRGGSGSHQREKHRVER